MKYIMMLEISGHIPGGGERHYVALNESEFNDLFDRYVDRFVNREGVDRQAKFLEKKRNGV